MKNRLADALKNAKPVSCFCGFDGFVDEVVHTVDRRFDAESYSRVPTLAEYGRRIAGASGLSINVEIVTVDKKLGGNGPIFANALKRYGASIVYIGSVVRGVTKVERIRLIGDRGQVRERAAFTALDLLRRRLLEETPS